MEKTLRAFTLSSKIIAILMLFVCAALAVPNDTLTISVNGYSTSAGAWHSQKIKKDAPVVIWFHGGMRSSRCAKGLEAGAMYFELDSTAIVISPSACLENDWLNMAVLETVDRQLDLLEKRIGLKISNVNLVGVSDGGLGVAAYSVVGKRNVKHRLLVSSFLPNMDRDGNLKNENRVKTGDWTFVQGGGDRLYPAEYSMPWIQNFCSGLVRCKIHFDPKGEHDWSYWKVNQMGWIREFIDQK